MSVTSSVPARSLGSDEGVERFGELLEACRDRMRQLVRFHLHPLLQQRLDIDDVVQDISLAAWKRLNQWEAGVPVSFFVWLRAIALQTIQNLYRFHFATLQRSVLHEKSLSADHLAGSGTGLQLQASLTSPSQCAIRQESQAAMLRMMKNLSAGDLEIITLRIFEDLSNSEAADVLGLSEKAASIRYVRAIDRLRRKMDSQSGVRRAAGD